MNYNDIVSELSRVVMQRAELDRERDDLIRRGLATKIPAKELAEAAGVSVQRISQIRHHAR